tara:strand:- start:2625 stop:3056 length:432 start_codon:yes stop_codon:yes gene_type:complete
MPPKKKGPSKRKNIKKTELIYKKLDQEYGQVKRGFGNCNFEVETIKGESKHCSLKGLLKKRVKIREGDLVLIEPLTESENGNYIIIFRYTQEQKKILEKEKQLIIIKEEERNETEGFAFEDATSYDDVMNTIDQLDEDFIDNL